MNTCIVDTSFLVSLMNSGERHHAQCRKVAEEFSGRLLLPVTVLPEVAYLLDVRFGHAVMQAFVDAIGDHAWEIVQLEESDLARCADILAQYADNDLDFVDATIIAMAERLNVATVLTLDRRHFQVIRPLHTHHFTLLPA
ncbi:MAG: PIN domain-containing protein [Caldilineaceae bacterium]|nr:PIN domain-containing protein [Caldilineaceae bacterium]